MIASGPSTNSLMNDAGNVLTSMAVSTDDRLQVIKWALSTNSPVIESKETVGLSEFMQEDLRAYPNPSLNGIYRLSFEAKYMVYSIDGILVSKGKGLEINLSSFPKGFYILAANDKAITLIKE